MVLFFGALALLFGILFALSLAVAAFGTCGDKLDHVNRRKAGKPNTCGCPLSR